MTDLPLNVVSMCTAMLDGKRTSKVVTYTEGADTWQARRIPNGFQFVLLVPTPVDEGGIENVPLPFPTP